LPSDIIHTLRSDILHRLPHLIDKAVKGYVGLASLPAPEDPKQYAAFQANCRAALAHLHLLLKLADWARTAAPEPAVSSKDRSIDELIRQAELALAEFPVEVEADELEF
jgi:hypothetical protein